jgi:lysophospholipase L1-like esterase
VLSKLADGKDVFWLDIGHHFVTSDGLIPRDLMPDYLHLSKRGYEIWADAIEDKLSELLGDKRVSPEAKPESTGDKPAPEGAAK